MADRYIVRQITASLLEILRHDLSDTAPPVILPRGNIKAAPPEDIEDITAETLILYLYQVIESPYLKNVGPRATTTPSGTSAEVRKDPLALDLYYLLIPGAPVEPEDAYLDTYDILGAAMASLHDHGSFTLGDWLPSAPTEHKDLQFRVDFNRMETSDLIRIWEAVQRPYRLSVSYVVRTARIESQLVVETPLVSQRNITLTQR